jgi:hypothetical protein
MTVGGIAVTLSAVMIGVTERVNMSGVMVAAIEVEIGTVEAVAGTAEPLSFASVTGGAMSKPGV